MPDVLTAVWTPMLTCDGVGKLSCSECDGEGWGWQTSMCGERDQADCGYCDGTGIVPCGGCSACKPGTPTVGERVREAFAARHGKR